MKNILLNIARKFLYLIAFVIVLMAILITVTRLMTPLLNNYRHEFEQWAGKGLGKPIYIKHINATWYGFHPKLKFNDVSILNVNKTKTLLHIDKLQIGIKVIPSLLTRKIQPSQIEVSGVHIIIQQLSNKKFIIKDINDNLQQQTLSAINHDDVVNWLFTPASLDLKQVHIDYHRQDEKNFLILLKNLTLENQNSVHLLSGALSLLSKQKSSIQFGMSVKGNLKNKTNLSTTFYANLKNIYLAQWLSHQMIKNYQVNSGLFNGKIWLHAKNKQLQSAQSLFDLKDLDLYSTQTKRSLKINNLSANAAWSSKKDGWQLGANHIKLTANNYHWPENSFTLNIQKNKQEFLSDYINIPEAYKLLTDAVLLPKPVTDKFKIFEPAGGLYVTHIQHTGTFKQLKDYHLNTFFSHLQFNRFKKIPGAKGLSGMIDLSPKKGLLDIDSKNLKVDFGPLFPQVIIINSLSGKASWHQNKKRQWIIKSHEISAQNDHAAIDGKFGLLIPHSKQKSPTLSLSAGFNLNNSTQIKHYLPLTILKPKLLDWLNQAFIRGKGALGTIVLLGHIKHFPFDKHIGTFIIDTQVRDTDLNYAPKWPSIKNINAHLIFNRRTMTCHATSGKINGVKINFADAKIPYMGKEKPPILNVTGSAIGDADNMLKFLKESPLNKTIGRGIKNLDMHGKTNLNLKLSLPLKTLKKTKINGSAQFDNAKLQLPKWKLNAGNLQGKLFFTGKSLHAKNLKAILFNKPITININTASSPAIPETRTNEPSEIHSDINTVIPSKKTVIPAKAGIHTPKQKNSAHQSTSTLKSININLSGSAEINDLKQNYNFLNISKITGKMNYQVHIVLPINQQKKQNKLTLHSNLQGVAVDLPKPFNKTPEQKKSLNVVFNFGLGKSCNTLIKYGTDLSTALLYKTFKNKLKLFSANVHFGKTAARIQTLQGLLIDGYLSDFNLKTWQKYFNEIRQKLLDPAVKPRDDIGWLKTFKAFLRQINVKLNKIKLFDILIKRPTINIIPKKEAWQIGITNPQIIGTIIIPNSLPKGTIFAKFKRLILTPPKKKTIDKINPGKIPALHVFIDNFRYANHYLGAITFQTAPAKNMMKLKNFTIRSSLLSGSLKGFWQLRPNGLYYSSLSGALSSNNLDQLLKTWQFKSSLTAARGTANFKLTWPNAIYQLKLNQMTGQISIQLKKGFIIDLGERADAKLNLGRLLTLLSIHRLLFMHFADLAHRGYGFDTMKGNLFLQSGQLLINSLYFDGSVAHIDLKGRINLIKKLLDLHVTVIPHVTSSLPIIATIAGGPVAGVITWVADEIFGKAVEKKISAYHYRVTGSTHKPSITQIRGKYSVNPS